jgi:ATP-dependent Clp protease protease subunit
MTDTVAKRAQDYIWEATRKSRILLFSGSVNERSVRDACDRILALEFDDAKKPITLVLNSPGGSVNDGYALVDVLRFVQAPVRVVCTGLVASMGISILIAVDKESRLSLPNARFMLHQPRFGRAVIGSASDLEITAREIIKMKDKSNREVADATGKALEDVERDTKRDLWLSASEAIEYGLISRIIQSINELD